MNEKISKKVLTRLFQSSNFIDNIIFWSERGIFMKTISKQLLILKDGIIKSFILCMVCFCNLLNHSGLKKAWQ